MKINQKNTIKKIFNKNILNKYKQYKKEKTLIKSKYKILQETNYKKKI